MINIYSIYILIPPDKVSNKTKEILRFQIVDTKLEYCIDPFFKFVQFFDYFFELRLDGLKQSR